MDVPVEGNLLPGMEQVLGELALTLPLLHVQGSTELMLPIPIKVPVEVVSSISDKEMTGGSDEPNAVTVSVQLYAP